MVNALKTQSVEPVMVMILSGQEPSEMLTRALLCGEQKSPNVSYQTISDLAVQSDALRAGKEHGGGAYSRSCCRS